MQKPPGADDLAKAADKADKAADKANQAVDRAADLAEDAVATARKLRDQARRGAELARQAAALAQDPKLREAAFDDAMQRARNAQAQAAGAMGDAASALRDAADGANRLYSALGDKFGEAAALAESAGQKLASVPDLITQGAAAKLGPAADALAEAAGNLPQSASNAAARAASTVHAPAMPAPPSSPALLPCGKPMPASPAAKSPQIDRIVAAMGQNIGAHPLRQEYMQKVRALKGVADNMLAAGVPEAEVAEAVHGMRRELGSRYKDITPEPLQSYIRAVNQKRYGDPLGPSTKMLREQFLKTNREIIESAARPNEDVDKLLSGFRSWLDKMPVEEVEKLAAQARKAKL